jgi:hypothetical protein
MITDEIIDLDMKDIITIYMKFMVNNEITFVNL